MCYRTDTQARYGHQENDPGWRSCLRKRRENEAGSHIDAMARRRSGDIEAVTPPGDTEVGEIAASHAIVQQFVADIDSSMAQVALRRRWRSGDCCNHQPATTDIEVSG